MPVPSSERRLTRSQARLGRADLSSCSPSHEASSPCEQLARDDVENACKASISAERGRRKVLADLAGNDSPIVGLIPGLRDCVACSTPLSDLKSSVGTQSCTKKHFALSNNLSDTPIGESLLRSQVQLLLQKVEADAPANHKPAPSLRALCHLNNFMDSPALKVAAPTPINTPCSNPVPNSEHILAARLSPAENPLSVQTPASKLHNSALNVQSTDRELLVQSPRDILFQDNLLFQAEHAAMHESGIKLLVDLNISLDAEAVGPSQRLSLLPKASENSQITIAESLVSGRDHQIMQISPLISEVLNEAETEILGKKTTRILQFDSPDKGAATEISCTGMASVGESFSSSMRDLEEDGASEWSVLVNISSPEAKHDEAESYGEDSADSFNSFSEEECSVHNDLQNNRAGSKKKLKLPWSVRRKGTPFRKSAMEDDEEEEEEVSDEVYSPEKEQEEYRDEVEQCQNVFNDLSLGAEKGRRR